MHLEQPRGVDAGRQTSRRPGGSLASRAPESRRATAECPPWPPSPRILRRLPLARRGAPLTANLRRQARARSSQRCRSHSPSRTGSSRRGRSGRHGRDRPRSTGRRPPCARAPSVRRWRRLWSRVRRAAWSRRGPWRRASVAQYTRGPDRRCPVLRRARGRTRSGSSPRRARRACAHEPRPRPR